MAARRDPEGLVIRPATADDLAAVRGVLAGSGMRAGQPAVLDFYLTSPGGGIVVACERDRVTGVAYSVSFGRTGWLGNVAVDPGARGRGIGSAVSAAAIDRLRQAGTVTALLTATDLGRPVYQRLGFADDGVRYGIWLRAPPRGGPVGTRVSRQRLAQVHQLGAVDAGSGDRVPRDTGPGDGGAGDGGSGRASAGGGSGSAGPGDGGSGSAGPRDGGSGRVSAGGGSGSAGPDVAAVLSLDAGATGEDRGAYLRPLAGRARVTAEASLTGYRIPLPWGGGPVVAFSPEAARALVLDMVRADAEPSLSVPEPNAAAASLAAALGFRQVRQVTRMRLGPPVSGFRPDRIFNAFSLAVG